MLHEETTNTDDNKLATWLRERDRQRHHRQLVIVSGSQSFCKTKLDTILHVIAPAKTLAVGQAMGYPNSLSLNQAAQVLGHTCQVAIYDAFDAFRPNALLLLAGTISRGGLLIICCPQLDKWPTYTELSTQHYLSYGQSCNKSHFRAYIASLFIRNNGIAWIEGSSQYKLPPPLSIQPNQSSPSPFASTDQYDVFQALKHIEKRGSILITADRGRGKSTLLGMLAACYLRQGYSINLCSRYPDSVNAIYAGIERFDPTLVKTRERRFTLNNQHINWFPVDHIALLNPNHAILIIDEAANLPIPTLKALCERYDFALLSTTLRGYEGTGRGFINRFIPWLCQQHTNVRHFTLETPCRWASFDPLEATINDAFQLVEDRFTLPTPGNESTTTGQTSPIPTMTWVNKFDPREFKATLSLLMSAHYQTTADELVRLCDAPHNFTLTAKIGANTVGVLNIQMEGGAALSDIQHAIASGERRVNGHLSAQAMSHWLAEPDVACYTFCRVNRIAVKQDYRRKGIASQMLNYLYSWLSHQSVDAITTSFGTTTELTTFWVNRQFLPVKPGLKKDASSAEYSLLMWRPISNQASLYRPLIAMRYQQELALHPEQSCFNASISANNTEETGQLAETVTQFTQCNLRILKQVIDGKRHIQHARASVDWLLRCIEIQKPKLDCDANRACQVLASFCRHVDELSTFIITFKLTGKKHAFQFATSHLESAYMAIV